MISIVPCPDYSIPACDIALKSALDSINGLDFVVSGMKIAVKANLVSAMKPESGATTHPSVIISLVKLLSSMGAEVIVGDSPGGLYNQVWLERVYQATGMKSVEDYGAKLNGNFNHSDMPVSGAKLKSFECTSWLNDCDAIINVCKLKTHGMMGMSAAVKNMFGAIPGTRKPEMHYRFPDPNDFADMLIDINEALKPRLSIVDAVIAMEGNGPTMGSPRNVGCILAGKSQYELDEECAKIIGVNPETITTITRARERGLVGRYEIIGNSGKFRQVGYDIPPERDVHFAKNTILSPIITKLLTAKPYLDKEKCIGCHKCRDICPAGAITMVGSAPQINRKVCIRCFCCQEFCPKGALSPKRTPVARILSR